MKKQSSLYKRTGVLSFRRIFAAAVYFGAATYCLIEANPVINLAVIVMSAVILADLIKLHISLFVKITADFRKDPECVAGKKFFITLTYKNYTPFCFPVCRFSLYDSDGNVADVPAFSIEPFGKHTISVETEPQYCGIYTIGLNKITVWDIFGLFNIKKHTKISKINLTVLPETIADRFPGLPKDDKPEDEDYQFRNYEDGDNLRLVNWKKSAGNEELIVKQVLENKHPFDMLLLYNSVSVTDAAFRDTFASSAATVAELLTYRRKNVHLYYTYSDSDMRGPFGTEDGLPGIKRALAKAGYEECIPSMSPDAEDADSVYIVTPGIPQNLDQIINNPFIRDKNVYVYSLIDDTQEFTVPDRYSYVIPLRYTLLRRGGEEDE